MIKGTRPDIMVWDEISDTSDAVLKATTDAITFGIGAIKIPDFNSLEDRVTALQIVKGREHDDHPDSLHICMRGSSKWGMQSNFYSMLLDLPYKTVETDLHTLQTTQYAKPKGDDPLFEAMDLHNARIKAGKKAIRGMFDACPLPQYHKRTSGPTKAKDWEQ